MEENPEQVMVLVNHARPELKSKDDGNKYLLCED